MKLNKTLIIVGSIIVLLLIGVGSCVATRNSIVSADQAVKKAWGNVNSAYQQRYDMIPNLVNTVKGAATNEENVQLGVTQARAGLDPNVEKAGDDLNTAVASAKQAGNNVTPDQLNQLESRYQIYVNAVHEAYPAITASQNFTELQTQIEGTENRIRTERKRYNDAVEAYNNKILRFPGSVFAWGYTEKDPFEAVAGAEIAPNVNFKN